MYIAGKYLLSVLFTIILLIPQTTFSQTREEIEEKIDLFMDQVLPLMNEWSQDELLSRVLEIKEDINTHLYDDRQRYIEWLNLTGNILSLFDRDEEAIQYFLEGVALIKMHKIYGTTHARILSGLAKSYNKLSDFDKARTYAFMSAEVYKDQTGEDSAEYGNLLNMIGRTYLEEGDPLEAIVYIEKSLDILHKISEDKKVNYAITLTNTGQAYCQIGLLEKALNLQLKANEIILEEYGDLHPVFAANLITTGFIYHDLSDFENAFIFIRKAIEICRSLAMEKSLLYSKALHNYASVYSSTGDYQKALELYKESLLILTNTTENNTTDYFRTILNIGDMYQKTGNYEKASDYFLIYNQGIIELTGKNSLLYAASLNGLGWNYYRSGAYRKAAECYNEAVDIMHTLGLLIHPLTAQLFQNSFYICLDEGYTDNAIKLAEQALNILYSLYGPDHPDISLYLNSLALAYLVSNDYEKSTEIYLSIIPRFISQTKNNFLFMPEAGREKYWMTIELYKTYCYAALHHCLTTELNQAVYDLILFSKGLLLNSSIEFSKLIREADNENMTFQYEHLQAIRTRINHLYDNPVPDIKEEMEELQHEATILERNLLEKAKELGYYTDNLTTSWKDIQQELTDESVCIEFIDFTFLNTTYYGALVLEKEMEYPEYIPLFTRDELENFRCDSTALKEILTSGTPEQISNLYNNEDLCELIWFKFPLEKYVKEKEYIFFATSGLLHQIAIEYLPVTDSMRMCDIFEFIRLSSTRELIADKPSRMAGREKAVLYGGLDYNTSPELMTEHAREYEKRGSTRLLDWSASQHTHLWRHLPGTLKEVRTIAATLDSMNFKTTVYTDTRGSEESFKALSGKSPQLLHIATHGFYFPDESRYVKKHPFLLMEESKDHILYHSGLVLTGANTLRDKEQRKIFNMEDGILTAKEISELNLQDTQLVVLSACQTGLGEITGEGVFGLQRAFKKAGVGGLLMSLWEVHDQATRLLMTEFYKIMAGGTYKWEALRQAQQKIKEHTFKINGKTYSGSDPYFWAGFILLD